MAAKAILSGKSDYLYTGQEFDEETGLHNYRARMMSGTDELGRFFAMDPQMQFHSPYVYAGNNPVSLTDPDGEFVPLVIVGGMVVGAYMGGVMANNGDFTPFGGKQGSWDFRSEKTWKYMAAGAIVGGLSAQTGFAIATSGIPMANTAAIMGSSMVNSVGTHIYTDGMTDISMSFGVGSYNFTRNEWGYFQKEGNSKLQNWGYFLGAMTNVRDGVLLSKTASFSLDTDIDMPWEEGAPGHNSSKGEGFTMNEKGDKITENSFSYGPNGSKKFNPTLRKIGFQKSIRNYTPAKEFSIPNIKVNRAIFEAVYSKADNVKYQFLLFSCTNVSSAAYWLNGIPNLMFLPMLHHASIWLYMSGVRIDLMSHYAQNGAYND